MLCAIYTSECTYAQADLDSIFIRWNTLTFRSLERQKKLADDTSQKKYYENRAEAFKAYWEVKDSTALNSKSIRYKFLKVLFSSNYGKKPVFYLVESNKSGYKATIRNFIIYPDSSDSLNVDYYTFSKSKWQFVEKKVLNNCSIGHNLEGYVTKFWKGFNQDDVVVTRFEFGDLSESYFYLFYTLSAASCFKIFL